MPVTKNWQEICYSVEEGATRGTTALVYYYWIRSNLYSGTVQEWCSTPNWFDGHQGCRQLSTIPSKTSPESMSWASNSPQQRFFCLRTGQCRKNLGQQWYHLSLPPPFRPHVQVVGRGVGGSWNLRSRQKSLCLFDTCKPHWHLSTAVGFCMLILKSVVKISNGHFVTKLWPVCEVWFYDFSWCSGNHTYHRFYYIFWKLTTGSKILCPCSNYIIL